MFPSGNQRAKSPVLYNRSPGLYGFSMNFSLVSSGLFKYPGDMPSPDMQSSPFTPIGCNWSPETDKM